MLATCSTPRRERTKARVRTSSRTRSVSSSAVSEEAARRTGAPFSPRNEVKGGSHRARVTAPRGEWSPVTARTSRPVSREAVTSGSAMVAEASTNVGEAPYSAATRRSRRRTWATCAPKTPR